MLQPLTQGGGAEKYFVDLARNFSEKGCSADIVTMDEKFFRKFARLLHIFARCNFFGEIDTAGRESKEEVLRQLEKARWLRVNFSGLRKILGSYDVIYAKNELVDLFLLKMIGYKKLPPIIVGVHTPIFFPEAKSFIARLHNFLYSGFVYRRLLRGVKCVHVSNGFAKKKIYERFGIKSRLIHYPFSVEKVRRTAEKNRSGIYFDAKKTNIVFTGRLSEQKGFQTLVDLIKRISREKNLENRVKLNIFGSSGLGEDAKIEDMSRKFDFLNYFGHIENKFIPDILSRQDFAIVPSKWETFPYSVLEAQAMGVPVVSFDISGPNDIIRSGETGFLAKDKRDFFEKVKYLSEEKNIFDGEIIKENIKNRFDPDKIHGELMKMFQENLRSS